jgi:hypothetical protein
MGVVSMLHHNGRDGSFEDVSIKSGIAAYSGGGMSVIEYALGEPELALT